MIPQPSRPAAGREALLWLGGLVALAVVSFLPPSTPILGSTSFCLSQLMGLGPCWGCGLGESIGHVFHGDLAESWQAHPLGMVVLTVLLGRVGSVLFRKQHSRHD
jgi:hypothetical protein